MQPVYRASLLLASAILLAGCDKATDQPSPAAGSAVVEKPVAQPPFQRSGETLSVNVDNMPRQALLAKLGELTGARITADGDNSQPVSVHVSDASLRHVLSLALADAPYAVTMQYANLQDSFPASVTVTHYQAGGAAVSATPGLLGSAGVAIPVQTATQPAEPVAQQPEEPAFSDLPAQEQMNHFLSQPEEEQVSIIFDMEPTPEDSKLMTTLMAKEEITQEVKIEMLDSLSNGEYADSLPALKIAVNSPDGEVATRAVEVLAELGSEEDVPLLQKIAEEHTDEAVKQAARDAIETLQP